MTLSLQVAVLLSIIRTNDAQPKWKELSLPVGRTVGATQKMYAKLLESADNVPMNSCDNVPAARKMGPRGGKTNAGRGGAQGGGAPRGRKRSNDDANGVEKKKGKRGAKKVKVEKDESEEDEVFGAQESSEEETVKQENGMDEADDEATSGV